MHKLMMGRILLLIALLIPISDLGIAQDYKAGENPIIREVFTADPAPLVYQDTVFLYVGHDVASGDEMFNIPEWLMYSSTDMKNWKSHGVAMKGSDFSWSGGNSWASQVIEKDGKFWFYTTSNHVELGADAIGVAVSNHPTEPFEDAIGKPIVVDSITPTPQDPHDWDDLDPTAFTDDDGTTWIAWGNMHLYLAKLKDNMIEIDGEIQEIYLPNYTEGPWLYKRKDLYYLTYACFAHQDMFEKICYATASDITGPWEYQGIIMDRTEKSYTIHPAIVEFKGQWYFFYHTGQLTIGDESGAIGRRAVSIEYLYYNEDGTIKPIEKTKDGLSVSPEKPVEYKAPLFNLNGPLTKVESDLVITQKHGTAVKEWKGSPALQITKNPYQHAIQSESFNGEESDKPNAEFLGQSFTIKSDFTTEKISIYVGDGYGTGPQNPVTIALYDMGKESAGDSYEPGDNLLGDIEGLKLNYDPQALGLYEMELPEDRRLMLQKGHQYVIELQGIRETAPLFWYRSRGDIYPDGAAFRDREIIRDDTTTSDFLIGLYGEN